MTFQELYDKVKQLKEELEDKELRGSKERQARVDLRNLESQMKVRLAQEAASAVDTSRLDEFSDIDGLINDVKSEIEKEEARKALFDRITGTIGKIRGFVGG